MLNNLESKKIAFFGTPQFTVEFLELFKSLNLDIQLIVTGEDKPAGRGQQMRSPAPKLWADKNGVKVLQPKKLDEEFYNTLKDLEADLNIVIAYGKIIPEKIINLPKYGTINLHYSLLPKYRGASPVESAILNGDTETGITIQQMVYKLDAGNILFQEKVEIKEEETTTMLREKLNQKALEIFPGFLEKLFAEQKSPPSTLFRQGGGIVQDESQATSCGKFEKQDFEVTKELKENNFELIYKKYKAFDKRIYFFHKYHDKEIRVKITDMCMTHPASPTISKLLPESKKEISLQDFENSFGKIFI